MPAHNFYKNSFRKFLTSPLYGKLSTRMQNPRSFSKLGYRKYDFFFIFSSSAGGRVIKSRYLEAKPLKFSPPKSLCGTVGSPWVSPATLFGFWETLIKFSESMILYGEKSFFRFFFFSALSVVTQNSSGVTQKDTSIAGLRMFVA